MQLFRSSDTISTRLSAPRQGASVVEMALILPVFMMVLLGIVEYGRAMMVSQIVSNAAREGARRAILNGSSNAEVETHIRDFLATACRLEPQFIDIEISIQPGLDNEDPGNILANSQEGDLVTVEVRVPFQSVSYIRGNYLRDVSLLGMATMRHE